MTKEMQEYHDYLKTLSKKDLVEHAMHQMYALMAADEQVTELKLRQSEQSNQYLARCRSVGGVTLPPGV